MRPDWLTRRPIAHRGLHAPDGPLENSPAAARAACAQGLAIECDVQLSADGEAMVFHDFTLERLTRAQGRIDAWSARDLQTIPLIRGSDRLMSLGDYLNLIDGRVPLICEIKSRFNGDLRLARRAAAIAASSRGPIALKSFDPQIMGFLRANGPSLGIDSVPLGMIGMARFDDPEVQMDEAARKALDAFAHWERTRPDFLSFCVDDLPHATPSLLRSILGLPILAWTVRTAEQARLSRIWADQVIFEGEASSLS